MSNRPTKPEESVTRNQAERAIYIDFEGFEDTAPSLLGILVGESLEQVVFDHRLSLAAKAKGLPIETLQECISRLQARSAAESRLIIAYSQHEKNVIRNFADVDLTGQYRDARKILKRWKNRCHRDAAIPGWGLKDFFTFMNYPRGTYLGERKTTSRLRAVADMLKKKGSYELLTPVVKSKWTKLLEHNKIDCIGMRDLILHAAGELNQE
jgi:hypothetical protein